MYNVAIALITVVPFNPLWVCSTAPSGCLKLWIVLNPVYTMFFPVLYSLYIIKLNLQIRHNKSLKITNNKIEHTLYCNKGYVNVLCQNTV